MLLYYRFSNMTPMSVHTESFPPLLSLATCGDYPSTSTLNRFSTVCYTAATALLVGGLVGVSVLMHSDLPGDTKVGVLIGGGLVFLGGILCCRLSTKYAVAAHLASETMARHQEQINDLLYDI